MRNPNGYGSVIRLSGKRRKPYMARKTVGWDDRGYPIYKALGYYATAKEANIVLAEYSKSPWDVDNANMTLQELYELWCANKLSRYSPTTRNVYKSYYKHIKHLGGMKYKDIRYSHMLDTVNALNTYGTINSTVQIWRKLDAYAYELDIIHKKYSDSLKSVAQDESGRTPFSPPQIASIFRMSDEMAKITLVYIYTGLRAGELLELEEITEEYLIGGKKTRAGKHRYIPVHPAIRPIIAEYIKRGYVFDKAYHSLLDRWHVWADANGFKGKVIHECRHTFETELDAAGASRKCIDMLMGHTSSDVGNRVYNHKTKEELKRALLMFPDYSIEKAAPRLKIVGDCF